MSNRPSSPLLVTVNVTGACELACKYCYFQPRKRDHMTLENFKKTLDILRRHQIFFLSLSGGDPFLHPEIDTMLFLAHEAFRQITVLTNGTRLSEQHLNTVSRIIDRYGTFQIQVSLDSVNPHVNDNLRGKTSVVLEAIGKLAQRGADVTVAIVVSSLNIDTVPETVLALKDTAAAFHIMPFKQVPFLRGEDAWLLVDHERLEPVWQALRDIRLEYGTQIKIPSDSLCHFVETSAHGAPCMAGFTKLTIDPNLDVRPCDKVVRKVVGNLNTESLDEIWFGQRLHEIYQGDLPYCAIDLRQSEIERIEVQGVI